MVAALIPVWKRWEETHSALVDCLRQFPEERFSWKPAPAATTAAHIVTHIARAEILYAREINRAAGAVPDSEAPGLDYGAVTDRTSALNAAEAGAAFAAGVVERLSVEDLDRVLADDWNPLGPDVEGPLTTLWFVEQMIRHKAYHLGQLCYLSMLLETPPEAASK